MDGPGRGSDENGWPDTIHRDIESSNGGLEFVAPSRGVWGE